MRWVVPEIWKNEEVFIVGGGASILEVFDVNKAIVDKIFNKSVDLSAIAPYFSVLQYRHVIGVNAAYKIGNFFDFIFFGDYEFFLMNKHQLWKFPAIKVSCAKRTESIHWVKYLAKDENKKEGLTSDKTKIVWNYNSGCAAINFAVHLGVKRIYLLGFDFAINEGRKHFHNEYGLNVLDEKKAKEHIKIFELYKNAINKIVEEIKAFNVELININTKETIEGIKTITLKEAL